MEQYKIKRIEAIRRAFNTKSTAYLCKQGSGYIVKYGATFGGSFFEKMVYNSKENKVKIYGKSGHEIDAIAASLSKEEIQKRAKAKETKANKNLSDVPKASDGKSG